jgi:hypothetical protein
MPIDPERRRRRHPSSITGALIVITVGVLLLITNLYPQLNAWSIVARWWPVAIILVGIGKVWEAFQRRDAPGQPGSGENFSAMPWVVLLLVVLLCVGMWREGKVQASLHDSQTLELGAAKDVQAKIEVPTGKLNISGGAAKLLDANFQYFKSDGEPVLSYNVKDDRGHLDLSQPNDSHIRMLNTHNDWDLRFSDDVPLNLDLTIGAGQGYLDLRGLDVRDLTLNFGTGELNMDLTGPRKNNLIATIKGGVGSARIRLPKDVGVSVHASGGIGAVIAHGLTEHDNNYTNDAWGKSATSITLKIEGGIGSIRLETED